MRTRKRKSDPARILLHSRAVAEIDLGALAGNYAAIRRLIPGHELLPMVKADAYGHGAIEVARALVGRPGLYGLGVATLDEAAVLRAALGAAGSSARIIAFSGALPWTDEKGAFCERAGIIPVIASDPDWRKFIRSGWAGRIPYELKINTGMNRLGVSFDSVDSIIRTLRKKPRSWLPTGVLTHLAIAEKPGDRLSRMQLERFVNARAKFEPLSPSIRFHLANSAAIWNHAGWRISELTQVARPGLSLYGIPPWQGAPARGLIPAMSLRSMILNRHLLGKGERVGYGGRFHCEKSGTCVLTVAAGYADGILRGLSGKGQVWHRGRRYPVLGTVSMDMCTVGGPRQARIGDWVEFIGPNIDAWEQAKAAATIPYELLTSVSPRVQRVYV